MATRLSEMFLAAVDSAGRKPAGHTDQKPVFQLARLANIHDEESRHNEEKHTARLRAVSEKIDQLELAIPQPIAPRLKHYLQHPSYDKALEFLEGRDD